MIVLYFKERSKSKKTQNQTKTRKPTTTPTTTKNAVEEVLCEGMHMIYIKKFNFSFIWLRLFEEVEDAGACVVGNNKKQRNSTSHKRQTFS